MRTPPNLRAETGLAHEAIPAWYKNITEANEGYHVYGIVSAKHPTAEGVSYQLFGSSESDVLPLSKETGYAEGREGRDVYNVVSGNATRLTTEINNHAKDKVLDFLYMPVDLLQARKENNDLQVYAENFMYAVKVKDYFVNGSYQHLALVDANKDVWMPLESSFNNQTMVQLAPFYRATQGRRLFSLPAEKVASDAACIVEATLEDIQFYKYGHHLLLIDPQSLVVQLENFYEKQGNFTIHFWRAEEKEHLSPAQLRELAKLAIHYQDALKSRYEATVKEYVISALNTTIHHNQAFVKGNLTTVETPRIGVLDLEVRIIMKVNSEYYDDEQRPLHQLLELVI